MGGDTAGGVAIQDQPARRLQPERLRRVIKTVPAPRRAGIVAADEREMLAALRHQMARHRNARCIIVEAGDRIDRRGRKIPGLDDRNAGAPQQPRAVFRSPASPP